MSAVEDEISTAGTEDALLKGSRRSSATISSAERCCPRLKKRKARCGKSRFCLCSPRLFFFLVELVEQFDRFARVPLCSISTEKTPPYLKCGTFTRGDCRLFVRWTKGRWKSRP
jgi:hypothetical protein